MILLNKIHGEIFIDEIINYLGFVSKYDGGKQGPKRKQENKKGHELTRARVG